MFTTCKIEISRILTLNLLFFNKYLFIIAYNFKFMTKQEATTSSRIITIMNVLFWIVFIGLCIKTGTILFSFIVGLLGNSIPTEKLYLELNISELYNLGIFHYLNIGLILLIVPALKTYMAYLAVKISMKINLKEPFSKAICKGVAQISYLALTVGILQLCGQSYCKELLKRGFSLPNISGYFGYGGEFLFLAGIIFIIAQVFKRGLEIQSENELTI
ncbi:DUF2975 domain-containing protein [Pedobacter sp. SL55]|uniref:DUF2975 domain-containing protein n=1 Tax=Pedobacter sp. SL55 TaxID=2995161 RepID=UPI00226E565A|nr:DUF2975 domain-containing protein [Pedobacter sp. SL55]WAC39827.1 DUF2975 domain-containing protein [Pedobacter sp. SL55]